MTPLLPNRRSDREASLRAWSVAVAATLVACSPVTPSIVTDRLGAEEGAREYVPVFVVAAKQKPRIVSSLRRAGIPVVDDMGESQGLLRATLGIDLGFRDCGTLNNVKYALRADGRTILEITARGWTEACEPNVFDSLSQELARRMAGSPGAVPERMR